MPERFLRHCREPLCDERTNRRSGFCELHRRNNYAIEARKKIDHHRKRSDDTWKLYGGRWEIFKSALLLQGNSICARIIDGKQCHVPVEIFHHLISPKNRPDLMFRRDNVIPLCRQHHPIADTPDWKPGVDFVPTQWRATSFKGGT